MPYIFDPVTYSDVWYEEGTEPPQVGSGTDLIPGYSDSYYAANPNQPASQQQAAYAQQQANATVVNMDSPGYSGGSSNGSTTTVNMDAPGYGTGTQPAVYSSSTSTGTQTAEQRNAFESLKRIFESYGLGSLSNKILEYVQAGYGPDTISLMLQDTPEYKQRFAGNEARMKNGLAVLNPAEYLSVERSYRQILESNGMPKGFFDDQSDFTKWISDDVSPQEISERVQIAASAAANTDSNYLSALREYGLGEGDLIAATLDRKRALPMLQKTVREAQIGAEARRQNLALSQSRAGYFESLGVTGSDAANAYKAIGEYLPTLDSLGHIYGEEYGQTDFEDELLGRSSTASAKRARIQKKEVGSFSNQSAVGQRTLSGPTRGEF